MLKAENQQRWFIHLVKNIQLKYIFCAILLWASIVRHFQNHTYCFFVELD